MSIQRILLSLLITLPPIAFAASPQSQSLIERQIAQMAKQSYPAASPSAPMSGTITIGKLITYDVVNYSPYDGAPADMSALNATFIGYSSEAPSTGSLAGQTGIQGLTLARMIKISSFVPIPEADLMCNLMLRTADEVSGVKLGDYYFPLTRASSFVRNGVTYFDYVAVRQSGPGFQPILEQNAFCTTFESFNNTYSNGSTVAVTLIP
ncbi:hypothetical protein [Pseudomonas sp. zfem005]|uniref:hypothetical protein n=1 Tax=Pseudomonas sp. zfem005 TaxID=3078200 RepID=UPI00292A0A30|nr:hypothetical protein [Pseudomonas sp. zfem005]MDU9414962.1 hypothetical protein [Pseudomonas sp. zfem005]